MENYCFTATFFNTYTIIVIEPPKVTEKQCNCTIVHILTWFHCITGLYFSQFLYKKVLNSLKNIDIGPYKVSCI